MTCCKCGGWNDPMQWPEEDRENYDPRLCHTCYRQSHIDHDDELEETTNEISEEEDAAELDALDKEMEGEDNEQD